MSRNVHLIEFNQMIALYELEFVVCPTLYMDLIAAKHFLKINFSAHVKPFCY